MKRFYAYAVTDGEAAREELGPDGEWGGIFTRALLEAFDAALPDKTGRVHGTALANYVHQRVGDRQAPDFEVPERHDIVFAERQGADLLCARLRLEPFGGDETVVVRDSRREVARTTPDRGSFGVELEAGLYKAIVEGTDRATLFEVPGEEVVL